MRRIRRILPLWVIFVGMACSGGGSCGGGGGCAGCGGLKPIPGGFPPADRINNAITTRLSPQGLQYFSQNIGSLINTVLPGGLSFNLPCTSTPVSLAGVNVDAYICDFDSSGGASYSCPSSGPAPSSGGYTDCSAQAAIQSANILPSNDPDGSTDINVSLQMTVNTGDIPVDAAVNIPIVGRVTYGCTINYRTGNNALPVTVTLKMKADPDWGNVTGIQIQNIDPGQLIQSNDLNIGGGLLCKALDLNFVKTFLVGQIQNQIQPKLQGIIDSFRCLACDSNGGCPTSPTAGPAMCDSSSNLCYDMGQSTGGKCPPKPLGLEGEMNLGSTLASLGGPPNAPFDMSVVAGGVNPDGSMTTTADPAGGLVIGVMGGTNSPQPSPCVPTVSPYTPTMPDPIDFDAAAMESGLPPVGTYDVGIGVADTFLNKGAYDAFNAGALCLNVGSSLSSFLSSNLFTTFLPSLGELTHGQNVPLLIALRPHTAPTVRIGEGTTTMDMSGNVVPLDPLLTIGMKQLQLDFYAFIEQRYVRLFSLTTDLSLPLGLNFDPTSNTVTPVLTGLDTALMNTMASNSELLAEDPSVLAMLLPKLIGLVQPLLGGILKPIAVPAFSGIQLQVQSARGAVTDPSGNGYEHLALYASLNVAGAMMEDAPVHTEAHIVDSNVPSPQDVRAGRATPFVVIQASATGLRPLHFSGYEYSYRVDGGMWTQFYPNDPIRISSPTLALEGIHQIQIVARNAGSPSSVDPDPVTLPFVVDYDPPTVNLTVDSSGQTLKTVATDAVWGPADLHYQYRVNGGAWSAPGAIQEFSVSSLGEQPWVEVKVTNGSGLSGQATYGGNAPSVSLPGHAATPSSSVPAHGVAGCSETSSSAWALLLVAAWLVTRRQRRA